MFSEWTSSSITVKKFAKMFIPYGDHLIVTASLECRNLGIFILAMDFLLLKILELELLISSLQIYFFFQSYFSYKSCRSSSPDVDMVKHCFSVTQPLCTHGRNAELVKNSADRVPWLGIPLVCWLATQPQSRSFLFTSMVVSHHVFFRTYPAAPRLQTQPTKYFSSWYLPS